MENLSDELIDNLLSLPDETLINVIFPRLPLDIMGKLCTINTKFNNICQDEKIWINRINNEFPGYQKPSTSTWGDFYMSLTYKIVPIIYNGDYIGNIWINSSDDLDTIKNNIKPLVEGSVGLSFKDVNNKILEPKLPEIWPKISSVSIIDINRNYINEYDLQNLKIILRALGLPTTGDKTTLSKRLMEAAF
jgi:hypothetical protein